MHARLRLFVLAVSAAFAAATTPAFAQTEVEDAADPFVHRGLPVEFPAKIDGFERGRIIEFDEDGTDASVGYAPSGIAGEMTIYLYPARGGICQQEFDFAKEAVVRRSGREKNDATSLTIAAFEGSTQLSAEFAVEPGGYGFDHPELVSYLWLACLPDGKWLVKYRGSFLKSDANRIDGIAQRLFSGIDWSAVTAPRP